MKAEEPRKCPVCGKILQFRHDRFCGVYYCEIGCPEHGKCCGSSLDNAIEAQREAEDAWDDIHGKGGQP